MVTPQLVEYIKNTLGRGYAEDKVRDALVKKGWKQADVDEAALLEADPDAATVAVAVDLDGIVGLKRQD